MKAVNSLINDIFGAIGQIILAILAFIVFIFSVGSVLGLLFVNVHSCYTCNIADVAAQQEDTAILVKLAAGSLLTGLAIASYFIIQAVNQAKDAIVKAQNEATEENIKTRKAIGAVLAKERQSRLDVRQPRDNP